MTSAEIGNSKFDFYVKTKCTYLSPNELEGLLILKKDKLVFQSATGIDKGMIQKLKQLDEELYRDEILKIEKHKETETYIDYRDICNIIVESKQLASSEGQEAKENQNYNGKSGMDEAVYDCKLQI